MSDPQPPAPASVVAVVAAAIREHGWNEFREACACGDGDDGKWDYRQDADHAPHAAAAVVEAQREAATITTVEQLDALPQFSIVGLPAPTAGRFAIQKNGGWCGVDSSGDPLPLDEIAAVLSEWGAALLLWNPEWVAVDGSNP